ncbi:MAG TPA: hypothetical protein VJ111_01135, partial [Chitinophagaceae bacterium]|nr:hypothetical protein [Chitinophagaceae bacterium]
MSSTLITNIKLLVNTRKQNQLLRGKELSQLPCVENAFLIIEDDEIAQYGRMEDLSTVNPIAIGSQPSPAIDVSGQFILPAWCDSHTHLVFAASREAEFIDK